MLEIYQHSWHWSLKGLIWIYEVISRDSFIINIVLIESFEFLFVLAYADGEFDKIEEALLIDVAAFFELDNEDFNKLYDEFAASYANDVEMSTQEALELLGLQEGYAKEDLEKSYNELLKKTKGVILDNQNVNKSLLDSVVQDLRRVEKAYKLLKNA